MRTGHRTAVVVTGRVARDRPRGGAATGGRRQLVVFSYRTGGAAAQRVVDEVAAAGGRADAVRADSATSLRSRACSPPPTTCSPPPTQVRWRCWSTTLDRRPRTTRRDSTGTYDRVMAVNVRGALFALQAAAIGGTSSWRTCCGGPSPPKPNGSSGYRA